MRYVEINSAYNKLYDTRTYNAIMKILDPIDKIEYITHPFHDRDTIYDDEDEYKKHKKEIQKAAKSLYKYIKSDRLKTVINWSHKEINIQSPMMQVHNYAIEVIHCAKEALDMV